MADNDTSQPELTTDDAARKRVLITEPHDGHPNSELCPGCPHDSTADPALTKRPG